MIDALGDRMKLYENAEAGRRFMPLLPIVARIDGRAFSSFTRGMQRPYDPRLTLAMIKTVHHLMAETGAAIGYAQSDEISLAWHSTSIKSQVWFDGRIAKMTSQLGAHATLHFYRLILKDMPDYADKLPTFDARVWQVPNRTEAANAFLWRELDAKKNSVSMLASCHFSPKELMGKDTAARRSMLLEKGVDWKEYPSHFTRGVYIQKHTTLRPFTTEEISRLPPQHEARSNPGLMVERSELRALDFLGLAAITNREDVIFEGAAPCAT